MADHYDGEGHERFISIEGVSIQTPTIKARTIIRQVQSFPTNLLDVSNNMIGRIMERAFEPVVPRAWVNLFWVHEIQRIGVAFQNKLAQEQGTVVSGLIEAMQTKLVDNHNFVRFRKSMTILICLWERANQNLFDQVSNELTIQLLEHQLRVTQELELAGHLRDVLLEVLLRCHSKTSRGRQLHPMDVMNHIEDAFR